MGRPKGSKSRKHEGYGIRTQKIKGLYGKDIYKIWGKKGGNPILKIKKGGDFNV